MSDSDDLSTTTTTTGGGGVGGCKKVQRDNSVRKKRSSFGGYAHAAEAAESDSVNENLPSSNPAAREAAVATAARVVAAAAVTPVRPNTKRKRKFKRMAIDPQRELPHPASAAP
jgi:hypothetical protein